MRSILRYALSLLPGWLLEGDGDPEVRTWAQLIDEELARWAEARDAHFPGRCGGDATRLAYHGICRGLTRGSSESTEDFVTRLRGWRQAHAVRGGFPELTYQLWLMWGVPVSTLDRNGNRHDRGAEGALVITHGAPWAWDDRPASEWARFWIIVYGRSIWQEQRAWDDPDLWGASRELVGLRGLTMGDVAGLRRLLYGGGLSRPWRPGGTQPEWLVTSFAQPEAFDGTFDDTFGEALYFESTWGAWSAQDGDGIERPLRPDHLRFVSLDPAHNNTFAGDPDLYPVGSELPDGTDHEGDPDAPFAAVTLPGGESYSGDAAAYPITITLIDDGDWMP